MGRPKGSKNATTKKNKKVEKEEPKITSEELLELMKGKIYCHTCGRILDESKFYLSSAKSNKEVKRMHVCKECLKTIFSEYVNDCGDIKIGLYKTCRDMGIYFTEDDFHSAYNKVEYDNDKTLVENGINVWNIYIKNINSLPQYRGKNFDCGQQLDLTDRSIKEYKEKNKVMSSEEIEKRLIFKRNKEDIIKIVGYYPFENEDNQEIMCSSLIGYLDDDEIKDDNLKLTAVISIIKSQQQENKINDVISSLSNDLKQLENNIGTIKQLTDVKEKIGKSYLALAKDNGISQLYSGKKTVGSNTLTGILSKLRAIDLKESQVNMYDIATSKGMEQVAMLSDKAIVENLNWSDDVAMDMIKDQRVIINKYYKLYMSLKEENRKLKVCCNYHDIDYKEDMNMTDVDWEDIKPQEELVKEDFDKAYEERDKAYEEINNEEKSIKQISVLKYCEEVIKEREEEERQKMLEEFNNE